MVRMVRPAMGEITAIVKKINLIFVTLVNIPDSKNSCIRH